MAISRIDEPAAMPRNILSFSQAERETRARASGWSNPSTSHQRTVNAARWLAVGTPNLMQRLPRFPSPPNICSLRSRKSRPFRLVHKHHPLNRRSSTRWCCVDRLSPPPLSFAIQDHRKEVSDHRECPFMNRGGGICLWRLARIRKRAKGVNPGSCSSGSANPGRPMGLIRSWNERFGDLGVVENDFLERELSSL